MATKLATIIANFRTTLATEIAVGGTSGSLQSAVDSDGVALPTGKYFFTLDGDGTGEEHIVCTCTAGALTSIFSVSRQGIQTSGVVRKHRIGASVEITDFAHIKYINDLLLGTTKLDATTPLEYDGTASITLANQLATKAYTDGLAIAGAPIGSNTVAGLFLKAATTQTIAGTDTNGTYTYVIPVGITKTTSAGAGDSGKLPVLNTSGVLDQTFLGGARTWAAVQSFTADNAQITTDPNSANDAVRNSYLAAQIAVNKFGYGDGSDGAFAQSAGTTTLNDANKYVYQYTGGFSLTGTASLALGSNNQNRPVYIFVIGDLTITSSATPAVDARGMGALGGSSSTGTPGNTGSSSSIFFGSITGGAGTGGILGSGASNINGSGGGGGGGIGANGSNGSIGSGGSTPGVGGTGGSGVFYSALEPTKRLVMGNLGSGGGGGSCGWVGSSPAGTGGAGGNGGGCIIFIVSGNINITSVFNASGANGSAGSGGSPNGPGGGGGGGGGFFGIFYGGTLTANTAIFTVAGGSGGAGANGGATGGGGGAGQSIVRSIKTAEL